jgi:hypothetical protein
VKPPSPFAGRHGDGEFRRRLILDAVDAGTVAAGVEDEIHHFRLTLRHDGRVVTAVEPDPRRWPWSPCAEAGDRLEELVGLPLGTSVTAAGARTPARQQCTHQFDLATLAVAHAARGRLGRRVYDAVVPDWRTTPFRARLWRDGELVLDWTADTSRVHGPDPFTGVDLRGGFLAWCEATLDPELAEAAVVLRRAAWMSPSRHMDLEAAETGREGGMRDATCWASQPERIETAVRMTGTLRDYGKDPTAPLADF